MPILDQMNVKANESDTQGTDYDIRDRKLTTATSQSGVNTSDVVLLKDTSGNYHEITKDSFMGAVRSALGSLIKNYDKGTNVNGIAVTGSTGTVNDLGFSSPSDLATVLGGALVSPHINIAQGVNLNDLTQGSYLCISSTTAATLQNCPVSLPFVLWVFKNNNAPYQAQMLVSQDGSYLRNTNTESWQRIATGIPSFYKNYSDLSSLASALGVFKFVNTITDDVLNCRHHGTYIVTKDAANRPTTDQVYYYMMTFKAHTENEMPCIAISADFGSMYFGAIKTNIVIWHKIALEQ